MNKFEDLSSQMSLVLSKLNDLTAISADVALIKTEIASVSGKLTNLEPRITESEGRIKNLEDELNALKNRENHPSSVESIAGELAERQRRSRNIIIYNLPECTSKTLATKVEHDTNLVSILVDAFCNSDPNTSFKCHRIGKASANKTRPLRVVFRNQDSVINFSSNFDQTAVRTMDAKLREVTFSRDRTPAERKHLNELRVLLKQRIDGGEENITIKFVNGVPSIVKKTSKND
jgi:hypothetical protein